MSETAIRLLGELGFGPDVSSLSDEEAERLETLLGDKLTQAAYDDDRELEAVCDEIMDLM
ncbi:hypothetical protein [Gordonibacter sp. Marseille-P4307]|uniref:hypothetical protein n=1 Tax=Gordonibacter sp. Marseille-P4307 TaxID=2161815 RepID=UPI000F53D700|nr:hypothetical protein [Gordonibacter sp. Marseille-P4307]